MVKKKAPKPDQHKNPMVSCRMPPNEVAALHEIVKKERRTMAAVIRYALAFYATQHEHPWPEGDSENNPED